jgi:ribonuclease D
MRMTVFLHEGDLPGDLFAAGAALAVDTETMGLLPHRDRLCLVQIADGQGDEHLVRFAPGRYEAPVLAGLLADPGREKLYHFARFDVAVLKHYLGVVAAPLFCTKIASRLTRTYTDRHGLKDLLKETLGVDISKQQQSSDWGAEVLNEAQKEYAASDVRYLHRVRAILEERLAREGRTDLARACFDFVPARAELDLLGWPEVDIFAHI